MPISHMRPHHGLCLQFFRGKGYSEAFVRNLRDVLDTLEQCDPAVKLRAECDPVCRCCPNNLGGICKDAQKVDAYDRRVLALCGIRNGDTLPWSEFTALTAEKILEAGRMHEVCGDCSWYGLCRSIVKKQPQDSP